MFPANGTSKNLILLSVVLLVIDISVIPGHIYRLTDVNCYRKNSKLEKRVIDEWLTVQSNRKYKKYLL